MRSRTGHTLIELSIALIVAAALMTVAARPLHRARHEVAVAAARRELASAVAVTRSTAILGGGARLVVDLPSATAWIESAAGVIPGSVRDLGARYGVSIEADRSPRVEIRFDGLGVGRLANTTIRLRRGDVESRIIISAYGRVRS
jgi:type II secretory pathway pseudopilin PulG